VSRSGYVDDDDQLAIGRWRGAVRSAMRGKRGQSFLRQMLEALNAMPEKRLITKHLVNSDGDVCGLGAIGKTRGLDMREIDPEDREAVAAKFGIAHAMACEIMHENDEFWQPESNENRWYRMRLWIESQIDGEA
jgi:hypothetical protein